MMSNAKGAVSSLDCFQEYAMVNNGIGNKVRKRIWELTLEECRARAKVHDAKDDDDNFRILTLKLGKKVLAMEQIHPGCSRLRVPRLKVEEMKLKLLHAVSTGVFDRELIHAQKLQTKVMR
ncbi:hypothetical protein FM037_02675 [Shewanella psychropiezotolerans]|uniref:Uncharacterized protein n=1 Tax=Shewanella psychropiezotolerans TaxID=2593655 RepID=A0ABX5WW06_9GAMM|nr:MULTISPECIES: hypothetical protein [Shewanella]MPY25102.1 hypothetical protein [Shewanella sp. YLB-07]QDO82342.1 hypothetical protein FM037_02675 [Shewanella psychropiezotolerans]